MEQLIIIIVLGLISMLFKGKKSEQAPKTQKKPPTAQTGTPDPMRKLKEMTQEMYQEIQREFQTEIDEPPSRQTSKQTPAPVVSIPAEVKKTDRRENTKTTDRTSSRESHRGRLSAHQGSHVSNVQVEHSDLIPKTQQDLIKGIIFAEILGPPKSKQ